MANMVLKIISETQFTQINRTFYDLAKLDKKWREGVVILAKKRTCYKIGHMTHISTGNFTPDSTKLISESLQITRGQWRSLGSLEVKI